MSFAGLQIHPARATFILSLPHILSKINQTMSVFLSVSACIEYIRVLKFKKLDSLLYMRFSIILSQLDKSLIWSNKSLIVL